MMVDLVWFWKKTSERWSTTCRLLLFFCGSRRKRNKKWCQGCWCCLSGIFFPNFENQGTLATGMLMHRLLPAFLGTLAALVFFFWLEKASNDLWSQLVGCGWVGRKEEAWSLFKRFQVEWQEAQRCWRGGQPHKRRRCEMRVFPWMLGIPEKNYSLWLNHWCHETQIFVGILFGGGKWYQKAASTGVVQLHSSNLA